MEKIKCAHHKLVPLEHIQPNPKNPNKHPDRQIEMLAKIIDYQGQRLPLIVSKRSGFLVSGHGRLEALKKLGWKHAGVDFQDFENEAQEYAHVVADNKIAELAKHDDNMMIDQIKELDIKDFELLGLDGFQLELDIDPDKDETENDMPSDVETRCKVGDIWTLGNHRLMCGDSTDIQDVEKLLINKPVDITVTSPPYNAGNNVRGNFYENDTDDKAPDDFVQFLMDSSALALQFSSYVFWNLQLLENNKTSIIDFQTQRRDNIKDILIWNKSQWPPHINKGTFGCKWEYVFVLANDSKSRAFPCSWQGKYPNVIETENASGNEFAKQHKATFPVAFPQWILEKMDFTTTVFDPFGGTGTTIIASEKLKKRCFTMELDPIYCDIILSRWEKYTGKQPVLAGK